MEHEIRERAYHMWLGAGSPVGNSDAFWLAAQREVLAGSLGQIVSAKSAAPKAASKPKAALRKRKVA